MILGITGAFGCGKSTVLRFFENRNWFVFDADKVCHSFYTEKNPLIMETVKNNFGEAVFDTNGDINRKKLGEAVFNQPEKMAVLTGTMYPLLTEKLRADIEKCKAAKINGAFEIPLLFEKDFQLEFDKILSIWTDDTLRYERLKGRNFDLQEIKRRDKVQMPPQDKLEKADFAVINNGSTDKLLCQLEFLLDTVLI